MLIDAETLENGKVIEADVAIVGAGPAGIVLALELAKAGHAIALLESGRLGFTEANQQLGDAHRFDPSFHAPMGECTRRQLGGTSTIWGGRCVPYDPVDFDQRAHIAHADWPVTYDELSPYFQRACDYFFCGDAKFNLHDIADITQKSIVPELPDEEVLTSTLERWSLPTNFGKEYFTALKRSSKIHLFYGLTCTEIETAADRNQVCSLQAKTLSQKALKIKARKYVLAGGALNTTRLLMVSDRQRPGGLGNHSGLLGRFYMGHLSGDIAAIHFTTPPDKTIFGFDRDASNIYLRRRFSFTREFQHQKGLTNVVAWLGTPPFGDPSHGSGIFSLAYLALNSPFGKYLAAKAIRDTAIGKNQKDFYWSHVRNVIGDLGKTLAFAPSFGYRRYLAKRKVPALFVHSASNTYPLHYHAEQVPNFDSRVSLADETDALGMRRLNIDLRYLDQDIDSVVRAHQYWDEYLQRHRCGYLEYFGADPAASIWEQAGDGFHQNGTTRMSKKMDEGVVDINCNIHGFDDLFVASSSVFVTSGQANSTFMIVVFALRMANFLNKQLQQSHPPTLSTAVIS
ncbi:MAG: GMC family oxidoreductase [Leptolyngbya sp. SIO4C1]|nr:GMC family oxidoreductase [Leptolyngbya sp. SIO4C1]